MNIDSIQRRVQNGPAMRQAVVSRPEQCMAPFQAERAIVPVSSQRRSFLKYMMLGSGVLVIGKLFGPSLSLFAESGSNDSGSSLKNFRFVEKGKEMRVFDKSGEELLSFDKTA